MDESVKEMLYVREPISQEELDHKQILERVLHQPYLTPYRITAASTFSLMRPSLDSSHQLLN